MTTDEMKELLIELKNTLDDKEIGSSIEDVIKRELQLAQEIKRSNPELGVGDIVSKVDDIVMRILDLIRQRKKLAT